MANCKSCKEPIEWVRTWKGNFMPIDFEQVEIKNEGDKPINLFDQDGQMVTIEPGATGVGHWCHFVTCEFADQHRKK